MRTTIALVAAAALSLSLVHGVPVPGSYNSQVYAVSKPNSSPDSSSASTSPFRPHIGIKQIRDATPDHSPNLNTNYKIGPRLLIRHDKDTGKAIPHSTNDVSGGSVTNNGRAEYTKRTDDNGTLGGNAYTGNSGPVDGGDVVNQGNNFGMPTMLNMNSNNAGNGGDSIAGCANGGHGNGRGSGGNAYSGSADSAQGGSIYNSGAVMNIDSNNAGDAGHSETGCATGGDVSDPDSSSP